MTSEELATAVKDFCTHFIMPEGLLEMCEERILGEGNEQYLMGDKQAFELLPIDKLGLMFEEEIADVLVYVVMLCIRFRGWNYLTTMQHLEIFAEALATAYCALKTSLGEVEYSDV